MSGRGIEMLPRGFAQEELDKAGVTSFLTSLRDELHLESLSVDEIDYVGGKLGFPKVDQCCNLIEGRYNIAWFELCGHVGVQIGLTAMLDSFVMDYDDENMEDSEDSDGSSDHLDNADDSGQEIGDDQSNQGDDDFQEDGLQEDESQDDNEYDEGDYEESEFKKEQYEAGLFAEEEHKNSEYGESVDTEA